MRDLCNIVKKDFKNAYAINLLRTMRSLRCCAPHCLTACSVSFTQMTCAMMSLPCLSLKYNHLQTKTLHNIQRNDSLRDLLREACEGQAVRLGAKRSAAPSARSTPTLWAYAQRNAHKDTPKIKPNSKNYYGY
ncbi:MAG: hypothetical protein RML94_06640 [Bacteroidia bacterium]|nr:hypothetical protein [Bacteroidia bacterium]